MSFKWLSRDGRAQTVYESAVDDGHGQVDAAYVAMWRAKRFILEIPIPWILLIASWAIYREPKDAGTIILQAGGAIAACGTCFSFVVGAIGMFLRGDKDVPAPVVVVAPTTPTAATPVAMPIAGFATLPALQVPAVVPPAQSGDITVAGDAQIKVEGDASLTEEKK